MHINFIVVIILHIYLLIDAHHDRKTKDISRESLTFSKFSRSSLIFIYNYLLQYLHHSISRDNNINKSFQTLSMSDKLRLKFNEMILTQFSALLLCVKFDNKSHLNHELTVSIFRSRHCAKKNWLCLCQLSNESAAQKRTIVFMM